MATTLTMSGISINLPFSVTKTSDLANASQAGSLTYSKSLSNGTGADSADLLYLKTGTLAASGTLNIDLAGSVTDVFGATITMARVKGIYVHITTDTSATSVLVGGHATAALANWITGTPDLDTAQPAVRVRNGGVFFLLAPDATGYAVTATTEDILTLTNADGSNTATYKVAIIGASA